MAHLRLPSEFTPNEITVLLEEKRRSGETILDLTESNPTKAGLGGAGPAELQALADPRGSVYEPCPKGAPAAREAVATFYEERARGAGAPKTRAVPRIASADLVLASCSSEPYA